MEIEKNHWLPAEITTEILSRLPVGSVLRFKSVCKTWQALLSDPIFYDIHLRQSQRLREHDCRCDHHLPNSHTHAKLFLLVHHKEEKNQLEFLEYNVDQDRNYLRVIEGNSIGGAYIQMVSSCNGLLCLRTEYSNYVYNPVTREYAKIPPGPGFSNISTENHKDITHLGSGFGYHSPKNEYKIVRTYRRCDNAQVYVGIYTLGSGKWRRKVIPDSVTVSVCNTATAKAGVQLSGCLHWLTNVPELVSFDLAREEFKVTSTDIIRPLRTRGMHQFGLLGGSLCAADLCENRLEISLMNLEGSCTRKFTVKCHKPWDHLTPIELLENGKILLHLNFTQLVVYDREDESVASVDIIGTSLESPSRLLTNIIPYMRSFASLKALGETSCVVLREDDLPRLL